MRLRARIGRLSVMSTDSCKRVLLYGTPRKPSGSCNHPRERATCYVHSHTPLPDRSLHTLQPFDSQSGLHMCLYGHVAASPLRLDTLTHQVRAITEQHAMLLTA